MITLLRDATTGHCYPVSIVQAANIPLHTAPHPTSMVCPAPPADMVDTQPLKYGEHPTQNASVKVEPVSFDVAHRLLRSPLPSSSRSSPVRHSAPSPRCKRKSSYSSTRGGLSVMTHPYGSWPSVGIKNDQVQGQRSYSSAMHHTGAPRRAGSGDQQSFSYADYSQQHDPFHSEDARHTSLNTLIVTSSLSGAMGDLGMSSHSPSTASPSGMTWTPPPSSGLPASFVVIPDDGNIAPYISTPSTPLHTEHPQGFVHYTSYNSPYPTSDTSAQHPSGLPSPTGYSDQMAYQQGRPTLMHPRPLVSPPLSASPLGIPMAVSPPPSVSANIPISRSSRPSQERLEEEVKFLKNRIRELELINNSARERVKELEFELARGIHNGIHPPPSSASSSGLPSPAASPIASHSFQEGWHERTDARKKLFCSLNRAGNALCAWHDSRRERRAHPPRMAPPGYLNCGCTHEEALFEESLARHGVGSYHPGENVRMDPALRNPLLKLLQERYGYRDGDFERDSMTGEWLDDEGPSKWQAKAAAGVAAIKKNRG